MWDLWVKSKCPNCGKEYSYNQIVSCTVYKNSSNSWLENITEDFTKTCECGTIFDLQENNEISAYINQRLKEIKKDVYDKNYEVKE